jgi:hypothetical protein
VILFLSEKRGQATIIANLTENLGLTELNSDHQERSAGSDL